MTTLHMDLEACQALGERLEATHAALRNSLSQSQAATDGIVGTVWISTSALEYLDEFTSAGNHLRQEADALEALARHLEAEIAAWNSAAARLGG